MPFKYSIISKAVFFPVSFHHLMLYELKQRKTMLDQFTDAPLRGDLLECPPSEDMIGDR